MQPNGWAEWSKYVLKELERLNDVQENINSEIRQLRLDFENVKTEFKIKSGIWGLVGGAIPLIGGAIIFILKKHV